MYQFLALTSPGIEVLLADELRALGAQDVVQKPEGVYFTAELSIGYKVCLWTRFATRVLLKLGEGAANDKDELFKVAASITWPDVFSPYSTFAVDFVGKSEAITNTQFGGLTIKDAIVDNFRDNQLERPSVDKTNPDIRIQARLLRQHVVIYLDFSGRSLFQRGYRQHSGAAPLKENLAAAIVKRSGWLDDISVPLVDPMCGSGTVLIEALSMAAKQAPGLEREVWGFESWRDHQESIWQTEFVNAKDTSQKGLEEMLSQGVKVFGNDIDSYVLKTATQNARQAGFSSRVTFTCLDANKLINKYGDKGVMLFNPPYGERIGELPELIETFAILGRIFKQQFAHWKIAILTANIELLGMLKLASKKRYKFKNGPLDCQLALYSLDEKQLSKNADSVTGEYVEQPSDFANRLKKNLKTLKGWIKSENISCYRCYDGDIPEFNVAIDVYESSDGKYAVIQEYAAPANIEAEKVAKRLQEVIYWTPKILDVDTSHISLKTREKQKGTNQYQKVDKRSQEIIVQEYGAKLKVNLWDYLDTGLFLDHRKTRQIVAKKSKGKSLLNLFAYTGSVSVQAALHGATSITTVDMSKTYLTWAEENFSLNKLNGHKYQFIQADCLQWLKNNEQQFDVVFIDPPTFSNSKRMEDSWDVQRDHVALLTDALKSLAPHGEIVFTNNKRNFKIDSEALDKLGVNYHGISEKTRDKDFARNKHIHNSWIITRKGDQS